ncbi:MAG: hypothetical protein AMXMBFR58_29010 [Phycisphaerae bacterium]
MAQGRPEEPTANQPGGGRLGVDRLLWILVAIASTLAVLALVSSSSLRNPQNAGAILWTLWYSGPPAAMYLVASIGWGMGAVWALRKLTGRPASGDIAVLAVGLGVSIMLTLSHALGVSGALGGAFGISGRTWAYAPIALGAAIAVVPAIIALQRGVDGDSLLAPLGWSGRIPIAAAWICGSVVLVVAACNPPGALWSSEFGGYDALSYHLQLPREWLESGVLRPVHHNVYSYLPGYVEAAFMHLGAMSGARDLIAGDGEVLISAQLLCAGWTVLAAWAAGRFARSAALAIGVSEPAAEVGSSVGAAVSITLPWLIVVGSLAYNESAMVLLIAAASAVAMGGGAEPRGASPDRAGLLKRGLICGWMVGVACGVKPTAIFMGAPIVGMFLVFGQPLRTWWVAALGACGAGAAALAPWLIRNWVECGNPVFPQLAGVFGSSHWSAEQVARYASAHHFDGGVVDRLKLLVLADESDPAGARHRGLAHPQWGLLVPVAAAATVCLAALRPSRRVAMLLGGAGLIQLAAWLVLTHIQSRFLLPLLVPAVGAIGGLIAIGADQRFSSVGRGSRNWPRWSGSIVAAGLWSMAPAGAYLVHRYLLEGPPGGGPNTLLTLGPGAFSGSIGRSLYDQMTEDERREFLADAGSTVYANFTGRKNDVLYLVAEATPLYYTGRVIYNTTYDRWLLGEAVRADPDNPGRWIDALRSRGVTRVLVNFHELDRLTRSGWADPAVTPGVIDRSLAQFAQVERSWDDGAIVLFRLR